MKQVASRMSVDLQWTIQHYIPEDSTLTRSNFIINPQETMSNFKFFLIGIVGGGVQFGPLSTAATNMPIVQPQVIMMTEKLVK
jgi:hypothetical protein